MATDVTEQETARRKAELVKKPHRNIQPVVWQEPQLPAAPPNFIVYRVVRDVTGQAVDFEPVLERQEVLHPGSGADEKDAINAWLPLAKADSLTQLYRKVVETGEEYQGEMVLPERRGLHKVTIARRDQDTLVTTITEVEWQEQKDTTTPDTAKTTEIPAREFEASLSGIMICETVPGEQGEIVDFRITLVNQEASQINGYANDEMVGETLLGLFPGLKKVVIPTVGTTIFSAYCQVVKTGLPLQYEIFYDLDRFEQGSWFQIYVSRLNDGIVLFITDSTESKKALIEVWQQASFIQNMLDVVPSGVAHLLPVNNSDGTLSDFVVKVVNKASKTQIGIVAKMATGKLLSELLPGYRNTELFAAFHKVLTTEPYLQGEFSYTYKGKNRAWIRLVASRHGEGLVVSFDNFTKAKRNEQALKDSEERLQKIIDTVQISVGLLGPVYDEGEQIIDFSFHTANQAYAQAIGQQRSEIIGTRLSQWIPGYQTNGLFDTYRKVFESGEGCQFDFHYNNDGFDDWVDVKVTKINEFLLITGSNYTRLKQVQLQAEALVEDLRKSNANLEKFAYVASHDLQEPLRKIQAFGDILVKKHAAQLDESGADIILRMQKSAGRMQTLIRDLLAYSRISSKKPKSQEVDLARLLSEITTDMETAIQEKKAQITFENLPVITGELTQLRQLFQNLLSNSLKFSHKTRPLLITINGQIMQGNQLRELVAVSDYHKLFACVEVKDNGIGFDPRYTERIFQVFQRLHGRSEYQGTGVGLAIVQKVVENHQGYLAAEGKPNEGATFRIVLPIEN